MLRASAKILGGVMQLVPVGQPVLGSFGKALTVVGDIDIDDPAASLGGIAGAFAPVVTEKIGPKASEKASKLFAGLKQAKDMVPTKQQVEEQEQVL